MVGGITPSRIVTHSVKLEWTRDEIAKFHEVAGKPSRVFSTRAEAIERYLKGAGLFGLLDAASPLAEAGIAACEEGFKVALDLGVSTLETDLAVTKANELVISHDPLLNPDLTREPDGQWLSRPGPAIRTLTYEELKRYDIGRINPASKYAQQFPEQKPVDGQRFPTLAEPHTVQETRPPAACAS